MKKFILLFITLLSMNMIFAQTETSKLFFDKAIELEQSGSEIEALAYYAKALQSDKSFLEAESRMNQLISNVIENKIYDSNTNSLMELRKAWDNLLLEAAKLIASNEPKFELRYFSDIEVEELTEQDYEQGTMPVSVSVPYLVQNEDSWIKNSVLAENLLFALKKIPQSKNWGEKINGFPWSYADDVDGENWLKKANAKTPGANLTINTFSISFVLNDKEIASQTIGVNLMYDKCYIIPYTILTNRYREDIFKLEQKGFVESVKRLERNDLLDFTIKSADIDISKVSVSVKKQMTQNAIEILAAPDDVFSIRQAAKIIERGEFTDTVKVAGVYDFEAFENEPFHSGRSSKPIILDISDLLCGTKMQPTFWGQKNLIGVILPKTIRKLDYINKNFSELDSLAMITIYPNLVEKAVGVEKCPNIKVVNYYGSKCMWETNELQHTLNLDNIYYRNPKLQHKAKKTNTPSKAKRTNTPNTEISLSINYNCTQESVENSKKRYFANIEN